LHGVNQQQLLQAFIAADLDCVLLKGSALALTVYGNGRLRSMSDVDIWIQAADIERAVSIMDEAGFFQNEKTERPRQLQELAQGEIAFYRRDWRRGLVELHWSPFSGWWLQRVTQIDLATLWQRTEPLPQWGVHVRQLSPEDMALHLAVHIAVNHAFQSGMMRALMDIALTALGRGVDWQVVVERAKQWRVATAVYTVLSLLEQLIGVPGVETALAALQPSPLRRRLISRFVSPQWVLAGDDARSNRRRYLLLLLLVDRPRDMLYLIYRTLWPEAAWMQARYGAKPISRWRHLWLALRYGQV
ncbi:MAG: nucleotidyltransferase family protein, partial [Anaerolineales bacterium]|nr:nucleotidyltransferase family protein [Anaerolineales bacterium]